MSSYGVDLVTTAQGTYIDITIALFAERPGLHFRLLALQYVLLDFKVKGD